MENPKGIAMLRCRRCRKSFLDSTCLNSVATSDDGPLAQCSIWHVNVDTLPEWILTSVHQAHWTVGKLHCVNCSARLGGFNFISHSRCPCGQNLTVHLSKSRVDHDQRRAFQAFTPRETRPAKNDGRMVQDGVRSELGNPQDTGDSQAGFQWGCDVLSCITSAPALTITSVMAPTITSIPAPTITSVVAQTITSVMAPTITSVTAPTKSRAAASYCLADGDSRLPCPTVQRCITHRKRCRLQEDSPSSSTGLFTPRCRVETTCQATSSRTATGRMDCSVCPATVHHMTQQLNHPSASGSTSNSHWVDCERRRVLLDQPAVSAMEAPGTSQVPDSRFLRGSTISESIGEQDMPQTYTASTTLNRLSKREKNRLKSNRRKQRRRDRWIHSQQGQSLNGLLSDSEEEDREGFTCAVCLDIYYSPYSCHPCGHVFCEPCLRTLAKNCPNNTPCPLCRTPISHTLLQNELNQSAKAFFPKVYHSRMHNFQRATCAKWPLPSCRKRFRIFWGYQRQAAEAGRRWHFSPVGFTLDALDLAGLRGRLFDVDLVIIYIHSVNWILAFLLLCFLIYFFFS